MTDNTTYYTFKTKEEVLDSIKLKVNKDVIKTTIKTIANVTVRATPYSGFTPELLIQAMSCNLYSGYNCVRSLGWQLQELFVLVTDRNKCNDNGVKEDMSWFSGKEVDVIVIDNYPTYRVVAIGDADKDKWITLSTWASDVVAKHTK